MIGKVLFKMGEKNLEAVMDYDGRWHCRSHWLEDYLNTVSTTRGGCPADEGFGFQSLHHAAAVLKGEPVGW